MIAARDIVAGVFIACDELFDHRYPGEIESFIGIEDKNPLARCGCECLVAGGSKIHEREIERDYVRSIASGNQRGSVGGTGVHNDEFAG